MVIFIASCQNDDDTLSKQTEAATQNGIHVCTTDILPQESNSTGRVSQKNSYWVPGETIKIKFLNGDAFLQGKVKQFASQWLSYANIKFSWVASNEPADIKIGFKFDGNEGSWSYVGTVARNYIPQEKPSMNFGWFDSNTADTEFSRVILHEFGHALGLLHEMNNPSNKIQWNKAWMYAHLDKALADSYMKIESISDVDYTAFDEKSIMIYGFPKEFTLNGYSVADNTVLSIEDKASIGTLYPFPLKAFLLPNESLQPGKTLMSTNKRYELVMQPDGNLVLYDLLSGKNAVWATFTNGKTGVTATMQADGNFVMFQNGAPIWSTNTNGNNSAFMILGDDGNIQIYNQKSESVWSSKLGLLKIKSDLKPGESLKSGQSIQSPNKRYLLTMQSDGNLVLYDVISGKSVVWASYTSGRSGVVATMQPDGNLVLFQNGSPIWHSGTYATGMAGAALTLQDDGNAVIYKSNVPLWSTKFGITGNKSVLKPGESLAAGQTISSPDKKYVLAMQTDGNLVIYNQQGSGYTATWWTGTNGRIGSFVKMQSDGNFVLFQNSNPIWHSGTYATRMAGANITMQNDGNLVIYKNNVALWSTKYGLTGK